MHDVAERLVNKLWLQAVRRRLIMVVVVLLPWVVLRCWWGSLLAVLVVTWDSNRVRATVKKKWPTWLNAAYPNLEDSSSLLNASLQSELSSIAKLQRQRVLTRCEALLTAQELRGLINKVLPHPWIIVGASYALALGMYLSLSIPLVATPNMSPAPAQVNVESRSLRLRVTPPSYTKLAAYETTSKDLQVPQHSRVQWCQVEVSEGKQATSIRLSNGQDLALQGRDQCAEWETNESVFWTWSGDQKASRFTLKVLADEAPQVKFSAPTELLQVLNSNIKTVPMAVTVTDDYQVVSATLHLTLARGSGDNIRFSDKVVQLPQASDGKQRQWQKNWSLVELGMEPGDELYFFVRAIDNAAPQPHITTSAIYTIRLPALETAEQDVSVLPVLVKPESLRSQRQIIIDTEQLLSDMSQKGKLKESVIRARSESIADDQAALRRRYGKFLGEESTLFGGHEDEHDAEHKNESAANKPVDIAAQYGHAHDQAESASLFDEATKKILRGVLVAMWDAEKVLRAITPNKALAPENKALEGIKLLQQADRIYLHKAAFTPPAIKEEKRLSGDVLNVKNVKLSQQSSENAVPLEIRNLIRDLENEDVLPALWAKTARAWITSEIKNDEQRLAAQAAVQDVLDGCQSCRANLRAWLRQGITAQVPNLQGSPSLKPQKPSAFELKWHLVSEGAKP